MHVYDDLPIEINGQYYTKIDGKLYPSIYGGNGYGRSIGTIVGIAGGIVLAPYTGGASLLILPAVGGIIGGVIDGAPKTQSTTPQETIQDLAVTSASLGQMIPRIRGSYRVSGNIIQATDKVPHIMEVETETGGGGGKGGFGGSTQVSTTTTYTWSGAVALCEGPIERVTRIWADNNLVYDENQVENLITLVSSNTISKQYEAEDGTQIFTMYRGTEDQEPDPFLQTIIDDPDMQPAYRGTAYVVIQDLDLGAAGRVPNLSFEVRQAESINSVIIDIGLIDDAVLSIDASNRLYSSAMSTLETINSIAIEKPNMIRGIPVAIGIGKLINTSVTVVIATEEGFEETADTIFAFSGDSTLSITHVGIPIRTIGEISNNSELGVAGIISDGGVNFWYLLVDVPAIGQYKYPSSSVLTRFTLGSTPIEAVWRPGGTFGHVFVIRSGNVVDKILPSATTMSLDETITGFVNPTHIIVATSDDKVWVSNFDDDSVSHFTSSGDKAEVSVGAGPSALVEASDDYIWVANTVDRTVSRIHPTTFAIQTFNIHAEINDFARGVSGKVWAVDQNTNSAYLINTDGTVIQVRTPPQPVKVVSDSSGSAYIACSRTIIKLNSTATEGFQQTSGNGLACFVYDLCVESGINGGLVDISGLDNSPVNILIAQVQSARSIIDQLAQIYNFVGYESEGFLKFAYKSLGGSIGTISEGALASNVDRPETRSLTVTRVQEIDLPTQVSIVYASPTRNYHAATQIRQLINSKIPENPVVLNLPMAFDDAFAINAAEAILYDAWTSRESLGFNLPVAGIIFDPFDTLTIQSRNLSYDVRLTEIASGNNWLNEVKSIAFDNTVFSDFNGTPGDSSSETALSRSSRIQILLVDAPPLGPEDITTRYLAVAYPTQYPRVFNAAMLYTSVDDVSYSIKKTVSIEGTVGTVALALASGSQYIWDDTNTISVVLYNLNKTLSSKTDLEVLNGANFAMLGDEVIAFTTATLTAPGTYTLSRLLRGRKGTEWAIGLHTTDEAFVLLNNTARSHGRTTYPSSEIGASKFYKVVDATTNIVDAVSFNETVNGVSIKPWAPVLQTATRDVPSANDIQFNWLHRSRTQGGLINMGGIQWDINDPRQYQIYIYNNSGYSTILRTITTPVLTDANAIQTYTYTAADQTTDFGSPQATLYYGIAALGSGVLGYESRGVA